MIGLNWFPASAASFCTYETFAMLQENLFVIELEL